MYQGKKHKRSRRRSGKSAALLVSLLLLLTITVGGTIAFLMDTVGPLENKFDPSQVTTAVEETLVDKVKSNVTIRNTGDTEAWIRAAVIVTWQNETGEVYGQMPATKDTCTHNNCECDYKITWSGSGWTNGADGFWYHTSPVAANGNTGILIESCTMIGSAPEIGYYLNVEIIGSGIQSKPANVFETEWTSSGLKVNDTDTNPMQWALVEYEEVQE